MAAPSPIARSNDTSPARRVEDWAVTGLFLVEWIGRGPGKIPTEPVQGGEAAAIVAVSARLIESRKGDACAGSLGFRYQFAGAIS